MGTDTKKHHKVPRLLLKNFASKIVRKSKKRDKYYTWIFNKRNNEINEPNILDACSENKFYEPIIDNTLSKVIFNFDGLRDGEKIAIKGMEQNLEEMETRTSPIITKILKEESLNILTKDEKEQIAFFVCCQFLRTDQGLHS